LKILDKVFSYEKVIFILDDRADENNYYYDDIPIELLPSYRNYTKVEAKDGCITYKDVIQAMIND
jgi:hypothetical protein